MRRSSIVAWVLSVVAVIALVAYVGVPESNPIQFLAKDSVRRLFTPKEVWSHGEGGVSTEEWEKFKDEIDDFPPEEFQDELVGDGSDVKFLDELCMPYNGIDHINKRGCCPEICGLFCGTDDCWKGPGGNSNCCEGQMRKGEEDRFCGPGIDAPCLLDIDVLTHKLHDTNCKQFDGIDDRHDGGCCPPECGEFCGADYCDQVNSPPGASKCCAKDFTETCGVDDNGNKVQAPCLLKPLKPKVVAPKISLAHIPKGTTYAIGEAVKIKPERMIGDAHGATGVKFSVKPDLPDDLKMDEDTGEITGKLDDDYEDDGQTYTITAGNSAGKHSVPISFPMKKVVAPKISLAHIPKGTTYSLDKAVKILPKRMIGDAHGATGVKFSIDPDLPDGLEFDDKTGEITGKFPDDYEDDGQKYVISAKNSAGKHSVPVSFPMKPAVGGITFPSADSHFVGGEKVKLKPVVRGGVPTSCTIKPALPDGLTLDKSKCKVTGELKEDQKAIHQKYVLTAVNEYGEGDSEFTLHVEAALLEPESCSYSAKGPFSPGKKVTLLPTLTGGHASEFEVEPALPTGLVLDKESGAIQGVLDQSTKSGDEKFTVTAENKAGKTTCKIVLTVLAVPVISMPAAVAGAGGWQIVPGKKVDEDLNKGGKASSCTISPALPDGLELNKKTCVVKGALKEDQKDLTQKYTLVAKNSAGAATSYFTIDVKAKLKPPAKCTYSAPTAPTVPGGQVSAIPKTTGGLVSSFAIKPALPAGVVLDPASGGISGLVPLKWGTRKEKYVITATNGAGHATCDFELNVMSLPGQCTYATSNSHPTDKVNIKPDKLNDRKGLKFTVAPALPKGLKLEEDGSIKGTLSVDQAPGNQVFTIVAKNAVGQATCTFELSVTPRKPAAFKYPGADKDHCEVPGQKMHLTPATAKNGGKVDAYAIQPALPVGWKFSDRTGEIQGKVGDFKPHSKKDKVTGVVQSYVVTAWNGGGKSTAKVTIVIKKKCPVAGFPWLPIVAAILILVVLLILCCRPEEKKEPEYVELKPEPEPAPPPPPPPPPAPKPVAVVGLPLRWDTGNGVEKTVIAMKKPLGLLFNQKEMPIKITKERDGHGKDIGVLPGWVLTGIGKINEDESSIVSVKNMDWDECDKLLKSQVGKLPGTVIVPLKFDIGQGTEHTVHASLKPLGLVFEKRLPIKIKEEKAGSHGDEIGVKVGWTLLAINNIDVSSMTDFAEVDKIMHTEINKLAPRP